MNAETVGGIAHALGHTMRVRIVRLLAEQPECRGTDIFSSLPLAQSTTSQHISILRNAGLVTSHAVGSGSVYCLNPAVLSEFAAEIRQIAESAPVCRANSKEE